MKYQIIVTDTISKENGEYIVEARKGTSLKTFIFKGVEKHVEKYATDPISFMSEVKSLFREAYDMEDFTESLSQDLDLKVYILDLNNHRYYNAKEDEYTTSYEEGKKSYYAAWEDQLNETDGEKDFNKYLPDFNEVVLHGNELCSEDYFLEEWEREED